MFTIAPSNLTGLLIADRYQIEGLRHTGGFAHLYKAFDRNVNNRPVAIKVLRDTYASNDTWRQYFLDEASSLHTVNGPNVVVVHDLINQDPVTGLDFIVMEWIDGQNLEQFRLSSSKFDIAYLLKLASGIAEGVNGVHSKGLVHGDITPKNIMFRAGIPVIIDFGLAWDLQYGVEVEKEHCGTISFLAPERFNSNTNHGIEADIYALGAVLFFLLTGNNYFQELKDAEAQFLESLSKRQISTVSIQKHNLVFLELFKHYRWQGIHSSDLQGKLLARLNGLIHRMLDYQPHRRPHAYEVSWELKQILGSLASKSQNFIFPLQAREYSIVVANYENNLLFDDRIELRATEQQGEWIFETDNLYLFPEQTLCDGVLFHGEKIIFSGRFEINQQPFKFYSKPTSIGEIVSLNITHGLLQTTTTIKLNDCEFQQTVQTRRPLQVAMIIDGSMSDTEIEIVKNFVAELFNGLVQRNYDTSVTICIYGEYQSHPGGKNGWQMPFHIQFQDFNTLENSWKFIDSLKPSKFNGKGYAGSLEFGLFQLQHVAWRSNAAKHLFILGTSPPHPNNEERSRFRLFDFTIEEFRDQGQTGNTQIPHWMPNLHKLRDIGLNTKGIWIPPSDFDISSNVRSYIDFVWKEINKECSPLMQSVHTFADTNTILNAVDTTIRSIPMIESPINFPLLSPWGNN